MFSAFVIINLLYWFVWRPISFILRWLISKDETYTASIDDEENAKKVDVDEVIDRLTAINAANRRRRDAR